MTNRTRCPAFVFTVALVVVFALFMGCGGSASTLPNPAAEKCAKDGFELKPIVINGVTRGYRCVDPRTGKSCDVWDYYRGQCDVSAGDATVPKKN